MGTRRNPERHNRRESGRESRLRQRKPWVKKTPVQVVLDQAEKLKAEITEMEADLAANRRQLHKFQEARKLFEAD